MNRLDAAILIIRAFALYAFFHGFEYVPISALMATSRSFQAAKGATFDLFPLVITPVYWFALGAFLFLRSRKLAVMFLLPPDSPADDASPIHPVGPASAAFAVIGVAAVIYALPRLLETSFTVVLIGPLHERELQFGVAQPKLLAHGAQLVLGFLLFFKSRAFATLWWRKQAIATPQA